MAFFRENAETDSVFRLGTLVSKRYRILEQIAQGGHATVFLALDRHVDTHVALKTLLPQYRGTDVCYRFEREAKLLARIQSPYVIAARDYGVHKGAQWLAMPHYHESCDLWTLMEGSRWKVPLDLGVDILLDIATGLEHIHSLDIIHRDLNARNILCVPALRLAMIIDLGLGRDTTAITETLKGVIVGSVGYISPEATHGGKRDHRSDIFSFGILANQLLTGRLDVRDGPPSSIMPELEPLDDIIMRAIAHRPDDRFRSAAELRQALQSALAEMRQNGVNLADTESTPTDGVVISSCASYANPPTSSATAAVSGPSWQALIDPVTTKRKRTSLRIVQLPLAALAFVAFVGFGILWMTQQSSDDSAQVEQAEAAPATPSTDEELPRPSNDAEPRDSVKSPNPPTVETVPRPRQEPQKKAKRPKKAAARAAREKAAKDEQDEPTAIVRLGGHRIEVPEGANVKINVR